MAADCWMPRPGCFVRVIALLDPLPQEAAAVVSPIVFDPATSYPRLQWLRQRGPSHLHPADPRVAAFWRDFERVEHGCIGGQVEITHVGVPHRLACAERT